MRKRYSATYKAEIVKEKEEKTLNELTSETGVHPTKEWEKIAFGLPELFSHDGETTGKTEQAHEKECGKL